MPAGPHAALETLTLEERRLRAVETAISHLLRTGVLASLSLVVLGTILSFTHHPDYTRAPEELARLTHAGTAFPHTPAQVLQGFRELRGQAVIVLGLLLLIATPVLRVAVSVLAFVYQRDRTFVVITTVVLLMLLVSFLVGNL